MAPSFSLFYLFSLSLSLPLVSSLSLGSPLSRWFSSSSPSSRWVLLLFVCFANKRKNFSIWFSSWLSVLHEQRKLASFFLFSGRCFLWEEECVHRCGKCKCWWLRGVVYRHHHHHHLYHLHTTSLVVGSYGKGGAVVPPQVGVSFCCINTLCVCRPLCTIREDDGDFFGSVLFLNQLFLFREWRYSTQM